MRHAAEDSAASAYRYTRHFEDMISIPLQQAAASRRLIGAMQDTPPA